MEMQSCDANRVPKTRSFSYRPAKKLERGYKVYRSSIRNDEEAIL